MTSRKFSSDCGVMEGPPFATSVCQTFAATQRSMIACEPAQRSMTWKSGILEPGGWQSPSSIRRKIRAIHRYNAGCRPRPGRPRQDSQPLPRGRRVGRRHVVRETRAPPDDRSPRGTGAILQWRMVDLRRAGDELQIQRLRPGRIARLGGRRQIAVYPQMGKLYKRRIEAATR